MAYPYAVLRKELSKHGCTALNICDWLGLSQPAVSSRMTCRTPWEIEEIYIVMDKLDLDYKYIPILFPRRGAYVGELIVEQDPIQKQLSDAMLRYIDELVGTAYGNARQAP